MSEESCGNCRFWLGGSEPAGQCLRNPPIVLNEAGECPRPVLCNDDWRGEWKPKCATGTTSKLYQLPNGKWITPSMVCGVATVKGDCSTVSEHSLPPRVRVDLLDRGMAIIACDTQEAAEAMRDKIAEDVNAMVGGGCQVEASLADENKKLRAFAKEVIGAWPDDITISAAEIGAAAVMFGLLVEEFGPEFSDHGSVVRYAETSILSGQQK